MCSFRTLLVASLLATADAVAPKASLGLGVAVLTAVDRAGFAGNQIQPPPAGVSLLVVDDLLTRPQPLPVRAFELVAPALLHQTGIRAAPAASAAFPAAG